LERKPEMYLMHLLEIVIVLIIVLLLAKERPFVVGPVRIEPKDRHTWRKK